MMASGWEAAVDPERDFGPEIHVAAIWLGRPQAPPGEIVDLFKAIPSRRTNRRPFTPERPKQLHLLQLVEAVAAEGAKAVVLDGDNARSVADLVASADRELRVNRPVRDEIAHWIHSDPDRGDGIPVEALGPVPRTDRAMVRDFGFGAFPDVRTDSEFEDSPVLVLLSTQGDNTDDWISAGQALQRLQLTATHVGLATSLLGQPLETGLRDALRHATLTPGTPQMLLRVGYAPGAPPTPRRNLEQVLRHDPWSVGRSADRTAEVPPARHHW
jgi:hypothetical protein